MMLSARPRLNLEMCMEMGESCKGAWRIRKSHGRLCWSREINGSCDRWNRQDAARSLTSIIAEQRRLQSHDYSRELLHLAAALVRAGVMSKSNAGAARVASGARAALGTVGRARFAASR